LTPSRPPSDAKNAILTRASEAQMAEKSSASETQMAEKSSAVNLALFNLGDA
jgi:hypothetical protein